MTSPSHSPGRGMLEVIVMACAYAVSAAASACRKGFHEGSQLRTIEGFGLVFQTLLLRGPLPP